MTNADHNPCIAASQGRVWLLGDVEVNSSAHQLRVVSGKAPALFGFILLKIFYVVLAFGLGVGASVYALDWSEFSGVWIADHAATEEATIQGNSTLPEGKVRAKIVSILPASATFAKTSFKSTTRTRYGQTNRRLYNNLRWESLSASSAKGTDPIKNGTVWWKVEMISPSRIKFTEFTVNNVQYVFVMDRVSSGSATAGAAP